MSPPINHHQEYMRLKERYDTLKQLERSCKSLSSRYAIDRLKYWLRIQERHVNSKNRKDEKERWRMNGEALEGKTDDYMSRLNRRCQPYPEYAAIVGGTISLSRSLLFGSTSYYFKPKTTIQLFHLWCTYKDHHHHQKSRSSVEVGMHRPQSLSYLSAFDSNSTPFLPCFSSPSP
ncbi:hypothetical protein L2E82_04819 [Cichorium intybus]|uniref:Uncharacterized protein n=1 Tax=Cichorium intybus TaxID=13427 RepID=A0ACB9H635_CICIN|nr:hypothetical protein L2E82_04819 [Cichorium intybus]